jgi:hypothetical protein
MTELLTELSPARTTRRLDPLSAHLQMVRDLTGRDALLESCDGEIVAYALGPHVSGAVCDAVLSRSARPLRSALRASRKVALAGAGPVRAAQVEGQTATVVPVASGGDGPGRLWLLGADATDVDAPLQALIEALGGLASRLAQAEDIDVSQLIDGAQSLPSGLAACRTFLLLAAADMPRGLAVERLRHAARASTTRLLVHVGVHQGTDVALISCHEQVALESVAEMVAAWTEPYGVRSLLVPWQTQQPHVVFEEARAALRVAAPGCSVLSQVRSRLFLHCVCEAVGALRIPGEDPVAALVDGYPEFARALLAWLDNHGDMALAAAGLTCHANTIRYRVRRAGQLLPGDLRNPAFRLEVHLRLTLALQPPTAAAAEQGSSSWT